MKPIFYHECQLVTGRPVLVGVSGGPDSLFLLDCLVQLGLPAIVAHFDHQLRPDSGADRDFVAQTALRLGLDFVSGAGDVRAYATAHKYSLEEAARQARYAFLFQHAQARDAQAVAVGHTADDQVETVLMHLLRGSGLAGLSGMAFRLIPNAWSESIPLVRPLLNTWREEIDAHLEEKGLETRQDSTNQDRTYFRNRLRHDLLPYLAGFQPNIKQHLHRLADLLRSDEEVLQSVEAVAWERVMAEKGPGYVGLDLDRLAVLPVGLQRRIIRAAIAGLRPGLRDIDFQAVERVRAGLEKPATWKPVDLAAGLCSLVGRGRVWIAEWQADLPVLEWPQLPQDREYRLPLPGELDLAQGWRIESHIEHRASPLPASQLEELHNNPDPEIAWFDLDQIDSPITARPRRSADRMQPFGLQGHSTRLSDLMINAKIPQPARQRYPVIAAGGKILWLPGVRRSEIAPVTAGTRHLVRLSCKRMGGLP